VTSSIGQDFYFEVYEGNTKVLTCNLKQYGSKQPLDVSAATQILFEPSDPEQNPIAPITLSAAAPGADWANGVLKVTVSPVDVTAQVGSWVCGLTIFLGGEEDTVRSGTVEVKRRPGYPYP